MIRRVARITITVVDACCAILVLGAFGDVWLRQQPTQLERLAALDERLRRLEEWKGR